MFSVGYVLLVLQSRQHVEDAWRQQDFECYVGGYFTIRSVKLRIVLKSSSVCGGGGGGGSFDEL